MNTESFMYEKGCYVHRNHLHKTDRTVNTYTSHLVVTKKKLIYMRKLGQRLYINHTNIYDTTYIHHHHGIWVPRSTQTFHRTLVPSTERRTASVPVLSDTIINCVRYEFPSNLYSIIYSLYIPAQRRKNILFFLVETVWR